MSSTEDSATESRARAAMRAIANTVNDAPPLQLKPAQAPGPAPNETGSAENTPRRPGEPHPRRSGGGQRRPGGTAGPSGRGRDRRWRSWLAPAAAAAVVVALAISLVLVRNLPNGGAVPKNVAASTGSPVPAKPQASAAAPEVIPRYYVALKDLDVSTKAELAGRIDYGIVVGDSVTGQTLATFQPPANTTFQNVTAAADDRTFVVFAVTSSTGSFNPSANNPPTLTGSWYELRLDPGSAHPATLSQLPVKPMSWVSGADLNNPTPGEIFATALSQSGQELAVADIPDVPAAAAKPQDWQEVKVFSVATGQLLRDWTANDSSARFVTVVGDSMADVPEGTSDLTWIDGDQALALATSDGAAGTVRSLNVAGPASGNLLTDSTVIWSGALPWGDSTGCFEPNDWPPQISADGNTITCATVDMPEASPGHLDFVTFPLAAGTTPATTPTLDYQMTIPPEKQTGGIDYGVLWVSPSADTLIVESVPGGNLPPPKSAYFGVVSNGTYTPLRMSKSLAASTVQDITF